MPEHAPHPARTLLDRIAGMLSTGHAGEPRDADHIAGPGFSEQEPDLTQEAARR